MIPSINDFTSHWVFDDSDQSSIYAGILFGENILVYNRQLINLSKLLNDNNRIHNIIINKQIIYVLLDNNNLYTIETTKFETHNLICKNVKNIFSHMCITYILQNNGDVLGGKLKLPNCCGLESQLKLPKQNGLEPQLEKILENISVVSNIPRSCIGYVYIYGCDNNNEFFEFDGPRTKLAKTRLNVGKVTDMCITLGSTIILNDNNVAIICKLSYETVTDDLKFKNVNCISAISSEKVGLMCNNNDAIIFELCVNKRNNPIDPVSYKSISIPNSPYCAKFNTQNIPYYPKYFMDRFVVFIMSVKYGCNIKLPKYLYFMIADYLR